MYLCCQKVENRVDTESMGDEHGDSDHKGEKAKDTVSGEEVFSPVREAGKEKTANRENNGAAAIHVESVTSAESGWREASSSHSRIEGIVTKDYKYNKY